MTTSIYLNPSTNDLAVDASGNIATCTGATRLAQDVGLAVVTFAGDCYYDTTLGIRYFQDILGQAPNPSLFKAAAVQAALSVPDVVSAVCYLSALTPQIQGQIQATSTDGTVSVVGF